MQLLEMRGGYLYQHRPDVIPQGYLTDEELALVSRVRDEYRRGFCAAQSDHFRSRSARKRG